jgi:hypothetical protein
VEGYRLGPPPISLCYRFGWQTEIKPITFFSEQKHFFPKKNIFFQIKPFFSEKKHFFPKKQHFFPKKNIFSETTTFFSEKKHFFPAPS